MTKSKKHSIRSMAIHREGLVNVSVTGNHHCGTTEWLRRDGKQKPYMPCKYTVDVTCEPGLDHRGFLFDQLMVETTMTAIASKPSHDSCELRAQKMAKILLKAISDDVPSCDITHLRLSLSPAPYAASVTVAYWAKQ